MSPEARRAKGDELIRQDTHIKNCKPTLMTVVKQSQKINADKFVQRMTRVIDADGLKTAFTGYQRPAFALAA